MKTILVPTDFSPAAENAINYAAEIGKRTSAKIILFHAFHIPVAATEVPVVMADINELEADFMKDLKKTERRLHQHYGKNLIVQCVCKFGFAVDEINDYATKHNVDLVVMGMQGAGYLTEKLIGSIATIMIRKSKRPVLVIDPGVKYRDLKKIAFAFDYIATDNESPLESLKAFAGLFRSHVYVLNVIRDQETIPSNDMTVPDFMKLEHSLAGVEHTFHYFKSDEVVKGINEFVTERQMDLVAMIPRQHNLAGRIFIEPDTKKMAFHSKVPLLALH